jgi:HK97 family phage prohead protease
MNDVLTFPCEFKTDDSSLGDFEAYASTFGNMDLGRDIILPGAFEKSIRQKGARGIRLLWQHTRDRPIGSLTQIHEDSKGLFVRGSLALDESPTLPGIPAVPKAHEAYVLMKRKDLGGMSIGFSIPEKGAEIDDRKKVRYLKEINLWEVSPVTFPMNPKARIGRVKELKTMDQRSLEQFLREAGISRDAAKTIVSRLSDRPCEAEEKAWYELLDTLRTVNSEILL